MTEDNIDRFQMSINPSNLNDSSLSTTTNSQKHAHGAIVRIRLENFM